MDLGDWQELSRLRFENHAWHRCVGAIREAIARPGATSTSIAVAVHDSVAALNARLEQVRRRTVVPRDHR
jgi:hypothetical protein